MMFKLGCPNCHHEITVSLDAEASQIECPECWREYTVPPLPQSPLERDPRRQSLHGASRFNLVVSTVAALTVALSVSGMLWLRTSNPVHGETFEANGSFPEFDAAPSKKIRWNEDDLIADFAPVETHHLERFVGFYDVVSELTDAGRQLFSAPVSSETVPESLQITRHRLAMETLNLRFSESVRDAPWNERLAPTSSRLGHGFQQIADYKAALKSVGSYSIEDFAEFDAMYSVTSHRIVDGQIEVTHYCLTEEEFSRSIPLRQRSHLCKIVSTYALNDDTLSITKRATGPIEELTRMFVTLHQADTIQQRQLNVDGLTDYQNAWLEGQTTILKRR